MCIKVTKYQLFVQLYELSTGTLLCSILFDFGLTAVTMDLNEYFLFVGGSNGQISQVNLFTHVRVFANTFHF